MEDRKPRKRIIARIPETAVKAIDDEQEFKKNKCSERARKLSHQQEKVNFDIWIDQHYHIRAQLGDEAGKREGIEKEVVEKIIQNCVKHLLLFGSMVKGFVFLNSPLDPQQFKKRLVIRSKTVDSTLNIAIEVHFLDVCEYEVTIKTAMLEDNFKLFDNEYVIDYEEGFVVLNKYDQKKLVEICKF